MSESPRESDQPPGAIASGDAEQSGGLWRSGSFLAFWGSQTLSEFGSQLGTLAMPVIAVLVLAATSFEVGLLNALDTAAFLVISLPAGAWLDRLRKRRVMLLADLARALLVLTIPVAWLAGWLTIWQLFVVGALMSIGTVFFDVGYQSFVPFLVPRPAVGDANGKLQATAQVSGIAGPGIAGLLLGVVHAPLLLFAPAATYLVSFGVLTRVRDREVLAPTAHGSLVTDIREGLAFVVRHPLISRITAATGTSNLFGSILGTLLPLLILRELALGPAVMGLVFAVGAVGGLVGAVAASRLAARIGEGTIIPISIAVSGIATILQPLAGAVPGFGLTPATTAAVAVTLLMVAELFSSFGAVVYNVSQVSFRQRVCPDRLLGRMNASIRFLVWGVLPIGALAAGVLASVIGVVPTMWIGAAGSLVPVVFVAFSPLATMKVLPEA